MKKLVVAMVFTALLVCILVTSIFAVSMDAKVELSTGQQLESVNSNLTPEFFAAFLSLLMLLI
jgi:hypothetical protein